MSCSNPEYINTSNVVNFGFSTTFDPYLKTITFDISDYTEFQTGGELNISQINFEVTDPQENTYTATINPSAGETSATITGLVAGQLYFGTYQISGTLIESNATEYEIAFEVEVCDSDRLTNSNYIKGCIEADANCLTAKLTITDNNNYRYNNMSPLDEKEFFDSKVIMPIDSDGDIETYNLSYIPYVLNLEGYYTGNYQIYVNAIAYYELNCGAVLAITYKSTLLKTVDCTADICALNCCWSDAVALANSGSQKAGQMQDKLATAEPYYLQAMGLYICGKNASKAIEKVNEILSCDCQCRSYIINPAPITLGTANVTGECGTSVSIDENGDIVIHSFVYTIVKGDPSDAAIVLTTTQINECTKRTQISLDYDVLQDTIINTVGGNITYLTKWRNILGINDCPCEDVVLTNSPTLTEVLKTNDDYNTLDVRYFTKSQVISGVKYQDDSEVTGGTFQYTQYFDQLISQQGIVFDAGDPVTLPCNICGASLAELDGFKLSTIVHSSCGCHDITDCDLSTPKVDYSERYEFAYRYNPHMSAPNYRQHTVSGAVITELYFNDVDEVGAATSNGGFIRKAVFSTSTSTNETTLLETRTLSGTISAALTQTTYTGNWGDEIEYYFPSSVNPDFSEIVNGEPVLYFNTFGGVICRMVRERCSECDERANWKTYVIGGLNTTIAGTGALGLAAGATMAADAYVTGTIFYGLKSFITDENGNMTFMMADFTSQKVFSLWYSGIGGKNIASNWVVGNPNIALPNTGNINCEYVTDSDPAVGRTMIWSFGTANGALGIRCSVYSGTNSLADIADNTNYATHNVCINAAAGATSYIDGTGDVATVSVPHCINKINGVYYFCNDFTLSATSASYLRYFTQTGGDTPAGYTFDTEVVVNNASEYSSGTYVQDTSSNISAATQGIGNIPLIGNISMFKRGMRIFELAGASPRAIDTFSGNAVAGGDLVSSELMDTQYEYLLDNCENQS